MQAYVYQAELYCEPCGSKISANVAADKRPADVFDESSYESDDYPKGPYSQGGGESDTPQHCNACSILLDNPLTENGLKYVACRLLSYLLTGGHDGDADVLQQWKATYWDHGVDEYFDQAARDALRVQLYKK